jgi:ribonuclease BN (tRNA processing enzyme)
MTSTTSKQLLDLPMKKTLISLSVSMLSFTACLAAQAQTPAAPATARSEFITLGTGGGPVIRRERSEPANAIVIGKTIYLFDTGSGVERQMAGAKLSLLDVRAVFISHHHIDHNADLGQLINSRWMFNASSPLPVIGPPGTVEMVGALSAAARPVELSPIGSAGNKGKIAIEKTVRAEDLAPTMDQPTEVYKDENIRVLAVTNEHYHFAPGSPAASFSRSYSFRIEAPDRTYVYTGDTGPSKNLEKLAAGADILVSEVIDVDKMTQILKRAPDLPPAMLPNMIKHMEEDHLTPTEIGKLAASAGVKEVVLTHVVPGADGETGLDGYVKGISPTFSRPVRLARDLDRF